MNLGARMAAWSGDLPAGCRRVAYLSTESKGPYIDTGINVITDKVLSTDIAFLANAVYSDSWIFGSYNFSYGNNYNYLCGNYNGWCFGGYDSKFYRPGLAVDVGVKHRFRINLDGGTYFDDTKIVDGLITKNSSYTSSAYLFGSHHIGSASDVAKFALPCKIWYLKMWLDGVLLGDFIPVVEKSGSTEVGCMYDRVTRKLFKNIGSGAFTWAEL